MSTEEEMRKFVSKIPETSVGKLKAMNECFLKEDDLDDAFKVMMEFTRDLMLNNPEYFKALGKCKTEEEIKNTCEEFFKKNPRMVEEVGLSLAAAKRNIEEDKGRGAKDGDTSP